jgi:hypothetical protein
MRSTIESSPTPVDNKPFDKKKFEEDARRVRATFEEDKHRIGLHGAVGYVTPQGRVCAECELPIEDTPPQEKQSWEEKYKRILGKYYTIGVGSGIQGKHGKIKIDNVDIDFLDLVRTEAQRSVVAEVLEIIGEDEDEDCKHDTFKTDGALLHAWDVAQNDLRSKLRTKIKEKYNHE